MFKYVSTKTYPNLGPVCYRQWKAESHCNLLHGYALTFHFEFGANELDVRNWVVDFGGLKDLKYKLEEWFDHTLLLATDDPEFETLNNLGKKGLAKVIVVEKTGCEENARLMKADAFKYLHQEKELRFDYIFIGICFHIEFSPQCLNTDF